MHFYENYAITYIHTCIQKSAYRREYSQIVYIVSGIKRPWPSTKKNKGHVANAREVPLGV